MDAPPRAGSPPAISMADGSLAVCRTTLLSSVPQNVSLLPAAQGAMRAAFLGASATHAGHRHVFPLGIFRDLPFMCCFRFKLWWMIQKMGRYGSDIPNETQFLLVESKDMPFVGSAERIIYTAFLPLLEGPFRASLQGNEQNAMELCIESGDAAVQTSEVNHAILVHAGMNPFEVISDAVRYAELHLGTFHHRGKKRMPRFLDWFGWCTWDAFYHDVTPAGVKDGIKRLASGGTPPRFVIIDDGWQSVAADDQPVACTVTNGEFSESRLTHIKENFKFQKDGKDRQRIEDPVFGLQHIVKEIKEKYNLKYVYIWHAIIGYWGGVKPGTPGMEHYESTLRYPMRSPSVLENGPDHYLDVVSAKGLGLVHPNKVFHFYDDLHSYLATAGIDGVKVDVQSILETLGSGFGGRVAITRKYHQALEASIAQNFPDNGCISCMSHNTDSLYSSKQTAVVRASDDFWPRDPASHTVHIVSAAYNSLFLGEFMQPDWDMFHSLHPAAELHAAARAVGGCAVYTSDKPGEHDFDVLKKLVLPDGSVLRAQLPGRPSRDCLFTDPSRDGKSLLKIWNMNKHTGVLGVFNCQGAAWDKLNQKNVQHDTEPSRITGSVCANDVELISNIAPHNWNGNCIMYGHRQGEVVCIPKGSSCPVTLTTGEYEVFTVVPIKEFTSTVSFAPIGLIKMFNAGGAIKSLNYDIEHTAREELVGKPDDESAYLACKTSGSIQPYGWVRMEICGCGEFAVYCSSKPESFIVESRASDFSYDFKTGIATLMLPTLEEEGYIRNVEVQFSQ